MPNGPSLSTLPDAAETDARLGQVAALVDFGTLVTDDDTATADPRGAELFGLPAGTPVPRADVLARFHPDDRAEIERRSAACLAPDGAGSFAMESRVIRPDGSVRWLDVHERVVFDGVESDRRPRRTVLVAIDRTEVRAASAAAAQASADLQTALDAASMGRWDVDLADGTVFGDAQFQTIHGAPPVARRRSFEEATLLLHEADRERVLAAYRQAVDSGGAFREEYRVTHPSEPVCWVRVTGRAVTAGRIAGVVQDITEAKQAEEALRQSEIDFRQLADATPHLVWTARPDGTVEYYNQRRDLYGGIEAAPDGTWAWAPVVHPADLGRTTEAWEAAVAEGAPYECEHRVQMRDGSYRWHLSRAMPARDESARVSRWYGTATDIHALKEADERLRQSEARYRTLFDSIDVGFCILDLIYDADDRPVDYRFVETNPAFVAQTGLVGAEGRRAYELIPDLERDWVETYARVAETGEPLRFENGSEAMGRWFDVYAVRVGDEGSMRVALLFTDTTEQRTAEQALRALNDELEDRVEARTAELERSNAELDQFAYVASHDLKAPLRAIDSLATWIEEDAEGALPEPSVRHLSLLRGRVGRMERLLDSLLTYSRVGRKEAAPEAIDTAALVREAVALVAPPAGVEVQVAGTFPTLVSARAPLALVIRNLVSNAVKHHDRPDGRVTVSARMDGDWAEFTIADDGPGIAPEYRDRVFGLFQTLRPRDEVEGSGMGLSIVKKAVQSRGGQVWIEPSAERGAMFRFTWPTQATI